MSVTNARSDNTQCRQLLADRWIDLLRSGISWPIENFCLSQRGQNWLQAMFCIIEKVILYRIIIQVATSIPA